MTISANNPHNRSFVRVGDKQPVSEASKLTAPRSDLSCVTIEAVEANVHRVPDREIPVRFSVSGAGELSRYRTHHVPGRRHASLRSKRDAGAITLCTGSDGLPGRP